MSRKTFKSMTFREAVQAWHDASEKYAEAGASDTEPRGVFADILEALAKDLPADQVEALIPRKHTSTNWRERHWSLYSGHPQSYFASIELTRQADRVVKVAKRVGTDEVRSTYEYYYGSL